MPGAVWTAGMIGRSAEEQTSAVPTPSRAGSAITVVGVAEQHGERAAIAFAETDHQVDDVGGPRWVGEGLGGPGGCQVVEAHTQQGAVIPTPIRSCPQGNVAHHSGREVDLPGGPLGF